jgi:hypothetical protein
VRCRLRCADARLLRRQAVVARLGGAVVGEGAGEAPATHTLQAVPPAEPPAGEEYFRVVEARHSGARAPAAVSQPQRAGLHSD